jgi:hypothetical protein
VSDQSPISKPVLSDDLVRYGEGVLSQIEGKPEHEKSSFDRAWVSAQRGILNTAKAASGYQAPTGDPRSIEQQYHDRLHGLEPRSASDYSGQVTETFDDAALANARELFSAVRIDPILGNALLRDMATAGKVDPNAVKATIEATGRSYQEVVKDAEAALAGRLKASDLSAYALTMLSIHGARLNRAAASAKSRRPS